MSDPIAEAVQRLDSLYNTLSNLGLQGIDKGVSNAVQPGKELTAAELDTLYRHNSYAKRIIDLPVAECVRAGWEVVVERDSGQAGDPFKSAFQRLHLRQRLAQADRWARLYGGGAILLNIDDGQEWDQPVNLDRVQELRGLIVTDRNELKVKEWFGKDDDRARFNEPKSYNYTPRFTARGGLGFPVHADRVLRFEGVPVPNSCLEIAEHWGDPVLTSIFEKLGSFEMVEKALAHLIHEYRVVVMRMSGLRDTVMAPDGSAKLMKRLVSINLSKSITGMILADKDEDVDQVTAQLTGLADAYKVLQQSFTSAAQMPLTLLFGQSPGGLSTDDASGRAYLYAYIGGRQTERYEPLILRVADILRRQKKNPVEVEPDTAMAVRFHPLYPATAKEEADTRSTTSQTDERYWKMRVLDEAEIRNSRFGGAGYSNDTRLMTPDERRAAAADTPDDPMAGEAQTPAPSATAAAPATNAAPAA